MGGWTEGWMDGWVDEWMVNKWMDGWIMDNCIDVLMDKWIDKETNGWMGGDELKIEEGKNK